MKYSLDRKRVIALGLLLVSFVFIMLSGMNISIKVLGKKIDIGDLNDMVMMSGDYTEAEINEAIYYELQDISEELAYEGMHMDPYKAMKLLQLMKDSQISLLDAARICSFSNDLLLQMKQWCKQNSYVMSGSEQVIAKWINSAANTVTVTTILLWFLLVVIAAGFAFGVYGVLHRRKYSAIPYAGAVLVTLILFIVICSGVNSAISQLSEASGYVIEEILYLADIDIGMDALTAGGIKLFHVSWLGVFSVLMALGVLLMELLAGGRAAPYKSCPVCGRSVPIAAKYCSCGHSFYGGGMSVPDPDPGPKPYPPITKTCPVCGKSVSNIAKYCSCGHSFYSGGKAGGGKIVSGSGKASEEGGFMKAGDDAL